ncbi:MAG: VWA domain-containing protein [Actinobacteria bacterium]|nr:VWA domain-containing protein [Actinomycetota bacterium]
MRLVFLTPLGALLAAGVLVPLAALLLVRRRARRVRGALGLLEPPAGRLVGTLVTLAAVAALLGLAAAQPVIERTRIVRVRTDAEAFVVLDVSRSMLARSDADSPSRLERAKSAATTLRSALPEVPVGVASLTDRVLPHLFPSVDEGVFEATVAHSLAIEKPPPRSALATSATRLEALASIVTQRYFSPSARTRLLLVLTDGESQPLIGARLGSLFQRPPVVDVVFVQFWHGDERVFSRGVPEPQYLPDPSASSVLAGLAESISGNAYPESELDAAVSQARRLVGSGRTVVRGDPGSRIPLAPHLAAVALAPLALLLIRRNR